MIDLHCLLQLTLVDICGNINLYKNTAVIAGMIYMYQPILSTVYLHTILLSSISPVAPDIERVNDSLRVSYVDVSGGSVSVTLAFDVRYVVC